jgi:thiamine-monophosphate kinase
MTEDRMVEVFRRISAPRVSSLRVGIGDDAAVVRPAGAREDWLITTDLLLEDVDFRRNWSTPAQLGHKALAVNLSDLAAMGARPRLFFVSLALPSECRSGWIRSFYRGMISLGKRWDAGLAGGDLSRSDSGILISITAVGESASRKVLLRTGAKPGDLLCVTGTLGKAAAGLSLLEAGRCRGRNAAERAALSAQRTPEPRCEVGHWLAKRRLATAAMDLSDGLSSDLRRLAASSGVGATVDGSRLPVFTDSARWGFDPLRLALHGGEDFELLFTVPARRLAQLMQRYPPGFPPISVIGSITRHRRIQWRPAPDARLSALEPLGWDHFR